MDTETTVRSLLVSQLTSLMNAQELDDRFVQMGYVEDKQDVLGEFLDYYTDDLLKYGLFAKEFTPLEIEDVRKFLRILSDAKQLKTSWADIRSEAAKLVAGLNR